MVRAVDILTYLDNSATGLDMTLVTQEVIDTVDRMISKPGPDSFKVGDPIRIVSGSNHKGKIGTVAGAYCGYIAVSGLGDGYAVMAYAYDQVEVVW